MKQITPEIKEKIFALYFGQRVAKCEPEDVLLEVVGDIYDIPHLVRMEWFIELKSLSTITNEDAIECLNHMLSEKGEFKTLMGYADCNKYNDEQKVNFFRRNIPYYMDSSRLVDHLRSKGYALPAFGYSVDELVEAGVFKLKEINND